VLKVEPSFWDKFNFFGSGSIPLKSNANLGSYTKIGRLVTITAGLDVDSVGVSLQLFTEKINPLVLTIDLHLHKLSPAGILTRFSRKLIAQVVVNQTLV
jgi:hypothetical protein